jgi:xylulose-5-phosphate/fructose-6-phosphate phosphoketolase
MKLQPPEEHPHGLSRTEFDSLFTRDKPVIFAFHGYPWLIHRLTYRRTNHGNLHVRGYKEEGTTTTPFNMCVLNDLDRFHLVMDVIDRVPGLGERAAYLRQAMREKRIEHKRYVVEHGDDMPEVRDWRWRGKVKAVSGYQESGVSETAADGERAARKPADTAADNI